MPCSAVIAGARDAGRDTDGDEAAARIPDGVPRRFALCTCDPGHKLMAPADTGILPVTTHSRNPRYPSPHVNEVNVYVG
jgi:hypothetical protein